MEEALKAKPQLAYFKAIATNPTIPIAYRNNTIIESMPICSMRGRSRKLKP